MYLVKADYKSRISTDLLDKIIAEGADTDPNSILVDYSKIAEDTLASSIGVLYDIAPELAKTGTDRNFLLLNWALSIATYHLYQRCDDEDVPAKVIKNYDDTIDDLKEVSRGKYPLDLPARPVAPSNGGGEESAETDGNGLRRVGSQKKRTHQP